MQLPHLHALLGLVAVLQEPLTLGAERPLTFELPAPRVHCVSKIEGRMHVIARSSGERVQLTVRAKDGAALEPPAGGATPCVAVEVSLGDEIWIEVSPRSPDRAARVDLYLSEAPETEATLEAASTATSLLSDASAAVDAGESANARELVREAVERLLDADGREHSPRANAALFDCGSLAYRLGELDLTSRAFGAVLAYQSSVLPDDHADIQRTRGRLANLALTRGNPEAALALFEQVVAVFTRTHPDDHPHFQIVRLGLANCFIALGEFERARALLDKLLSVSAKSAAPDAATVLAAQSNLAIVLRDGGDVAGARALLERVLETMLRTAPADLRGLAVARIGLAECLKLQGDHVRARVLIEQALEGFEQALPPEHPNIAQTRYALADTLMRIGDFAGAKALAEKALASYAGRQVADQRDAVAVRHMLATILHEQGDLPGARAAREDVLKIVEKLYPPEDDAVLLAKGNLACTLRGLGEYDKALQLDEEVLKLRRQRYADDHPAVASARLNLSWTLARRGDRTRSVEIARDLAMGLCRRLELAFLADSPRELEAEVARAGDAISTVLSLAGGANVDPRDSGLDELAWQLVELARGIGPRSCASTLRLCSKEPAGHVSELRRAVNALKSKAANLANEEGARAEYLAAVEAGERAERELRECLVRAGASDLAPRAISPAALARALDADRAVVSYWRYQCWPLEPKTRWSLPSYSAYVAWVVRPSKPLVRVELGRAETIEQALEAWRVALGANGERGIAPAGAARASSVEAERSAGARVRELVFDPLRAALAGASRIVVAPDDALVLVPFDALPSKEHCLGDEFRITTTTCVTETSVESKLSGSRTVLLGGVDYESTASRGDSAAEEQSSVLRAGPGARGFAALPGTLGEMNSISKTHREAFGADAGLGMLEGAEASKERLRAMVAGARFVHIATHGFFAPESVPTVETVSSDHEVLSRRDLVIGLSPMVLCGLALAGANAEPGDGKRGAGVVTAEKLAGFDFERCELAVLSACDTRVGIRRAGLSMASLQTALHAAGARNSITSLWSVPDEATRELMVELYRRIWIEKQELAVALWESKRTLAARGAPARDWAAWVLTGGAN